MVNVGPFGVNWVGIWVGEQYAKTVPQPRGSRTIPTWVIPAGHHRLTAGRILGIRSEDSASGDRIAPGDELRLAKADAMALGRGGVSHGHGAVARTATQEQFQRSRVAPDI